MNYPTITELLGISTQPETKKMNLKNLKLTYSDLTLQESDLIFMGLRKLPMESVEGLVKKLGVQAHVQLAEFNGEAKKEAEQEA